MENEDLKFIERKIGYTFNNSDLLQQAFVRRSYSAENGGEDNEILEFIGDKVLDLIVVKLLSERYGFMTSKCDDYDPEEDFDEFATDRNEAELTELKKLLVQKKTLANRIDCLGFAEHLIMGNGDIKRNAQNEASVKEDLFEAILGAVALDCKWDMDKLQRTVEIMLEPDSFIEPEVESNYVSAVQEWFYRQYGEYPHFDYMDISHSNPFSIRIAPLSEMQESQNSKMLCQFSLFDKPFKGYGMTASEALQNICADIYSYLEDEDLLFTIRDEIDNPNKNEAINQLETLARRGYFSIPTYRFKEIKDKNGNPLWICECHIQEEEYYFDAKSSSKKEAKKLAAFQMLEFVLED